MSSDPAYDLQLVVVAALLADPAVTSLVATGPDDGPAIYAPHQPFDDVWPRITIEDIQVVQAETSASHSSTCHLTLHVWDQGAQAALNVQRISGAIRDCLQQPLSPSGHRISSFGFDGAHGVRDPDPNTAHRVVNHHFNTQPTS